MDAGEQVRRTTHAHRRETRQRLVARRLDADPALDVRPGRDGIEGGGHRGTPPHAARPLERRSMTAGSGRGSRRAAARTRSVTASAAPGRPRARAAADIARCTRRVVEDRGRLQQRGGIEVASSTIRAAAPASARILAFARWCAARVRVRDDDHGQPQGRHLGQRGRPGPPDDQVGRGQRREHLVAQERVRPVATANGLGQGLAFGKRPRHSRPRPRHGAR